MSRDDEKKESRGFFSGFRFRQLRDVIPSGSDGESTKERLDNKSEMTMEEKSSGDSDTIHKDKLQTFETTHKLQHTGLKVMVIPENVYIEGSIRGECDAEIYGKISGNVEIKGNLILGKSAEVKGSIQARSCSIDGVVEGKIKASNEIEIGTHSKVKADVISGQKVLVSGHVTGNIEAEIGVKLLHTARVDGDIMALKWISMDDGCTFNGKCLMKKPANTGTSSTPTSNSSVANATANSQQAKQKG